MQLVCPNLRISKLIPPGRLAKWPYRSVSLIERLPALILRTARWREGYILERGYWHGGIYRINADVEAKEGGHDFFRNNIRKSHAKSDNRNDMEGQDMTF